MIYLFHPIPFFYKPLNISLIYGLLYSLQKCHLILKMKWQF